MKMKNKTIILAALVIILLISGCSYIGEVCKQFLPEEFCRIISCVFGEEGVQNMMNNMEVRRFFQTHPNAEITITLMPKQNVLKNINTLTAELGARPQIKDYLKLELKGNEDILVVWVDANSKKLNYVRLEAEKKPEPDIKPAITKKPKTKPSIVEVASPFERKGNKCWYGAWTKPIGYEREKVWSICK